MVRFSIFPAFLAVALVVVWRAGILPARANTAGPIIVLQAKGQVLSNGQPVEPLMRLSRDDRITMPANASLIVIGATQKIEIDGANSGRLDEILARAVLTADQGPSEPVGLIHQLFQKAVQITVLRDANRDVLANAWFLSLDTSGPKCVRPGSMPTLVASHGEEGGYLQLHAAKSNRTAFVKIGSDAKVAWPSNLPLDEGAYTVDIDGALSTLAWQVVLAPAGVQGTDVVKWLIDSKCLDQVYVFSLQLPNSAIVGNK
jgi:hypothetical protein